MPYVGAKILVEVDVADDNEAEKLKGVMSLIRYATLSTYMLVPTEEKSLGKYRYPADIPHYGTRGWCRVEFFIFALWMSMLGRKEVPLYGIARDGSLQQYKEVSYDGHGDLPSGGILSNPNDATAVKLLEETMIEAHGKAIVVHECKKAGSGGTVYLTKKLLRASYMPALSKAVNEHKITGLDLQANQLAQGDGVARIVEMLQANPQLACLR